MFRRLFLLAACLFATSPGLAAAAEPAAEWDARPDDAGEWIPLFNGKNLDGWAPKIRYRELGDNYLDTFRVEEGVLKVGYAAYDNFNSDAGPQFGHLFYKEPFSHYRLRVEYRFVGDQCPGGPGWAFRNSGVMIHGESPTAMSKDQDFPVSIEVQLLGGDGASRRATGNLCTPGTNVVMEGELVTRHCTDSKSETYHGDAWVTCEIEVHGNALIRHFINGQLVLEYNQPQLDERDAHAKELAAKAGGIQLAGGTISLQSESHPVEFRKVELMKLGE